MPRLRQQHPRNYRVSEQISNEFENIIRYLNSAELGGRTLAELLKVLFNDQGAFVGPVEYRRNLNGAIQVRIGSYEDQEKGWTTLFTLDEVRGLPGQNFVNGVLTGAMLESQYATNGFIRLDRINIPDAGITQAKVSGLVAALAAAARLSVSASTPVSPVTGQLWLDTGVTPNQLRFYNGTSWQSTTPESVLPQYTTAEAGRFLRVAPNGTGLEFVNVDLTSRIAVVEKGASNGVATLDGGGRIPVTQLPTTLANENFFVEIPTAANQTYKITRLIGQRLTINNIAVRTGAGSCSVQLAINGTGAGTTYTANTSGFEAPLGTPIAVDATASSRLLGFIVTNNSAATGLEVAISGTVSA